jgi:predicted nucleic acid-binding Zn ribbon protein
MARKIDRLSATIGKILKARGLEGRLNEYRVFGLWEKTVGGVIAHHAQPQSVRGKKLTLIVDSPAWMQQLSLLKPEILEKVNRGLGKDSIRDITLKLGEVASTERQADGIPVRASLDQEDHAKIEQYVHEIDDPDMKNTIKRVIEKDLLSKKREQKK